MEAMDLRALVASRSGESEGFELKKGAADVSGAVATLTAFANDYEGRGKDGWVVFGIDTGNDDHGFAAPAIKGLSASEFKEIEGRVLALCRDKVEPGLLPQVFQESLEGSRRLLAFKVAASGQLHFFNNGQKRACYVRSGSHTSEAREGLYAELLRRKAKAPPHLDEPCPVATLSDLDLNAAEYFFKEAGLPRDSTAYFEPDRPIDGTTRPLVVRGKDHSPIPTLLAILLFGREPTRFLPGAYAVLSVYEGDTRSAERSHRAELTGLPLPELIRRLIAELRLRLPIEIDKSRSATSGEQNHWPYSAKALDEAIVNAFAHRDYRSAEPTRIAIFENRIEIQNPGGKPPGLDRQRLQSGDAPPLWRNPSLAAFLLRLRLAQREGQGLRTILDEAERLGTAPPEILGTDVDFTIRLPARRRPPAATEAVEIGSEDALVLVSVGGPSLLPQVQDQQEALGLAAAQVLVDIALPGYLGSAQAWSAEAERIRREIKDYVEHPKVRRFHLFYRGPVVLAPLLGALISPAKPLWLYHHENGEYRLAYVLDRKFLVGSPT